MAPKACLLSRKKILFLYLQCLSKGKQDDCGGCVASQQLAILVPMDSADIGAVPGVALPGGGTMGWGLVVLPAVAQTV